MRGIVVGFVVAFSVISTAVAQDHRELGPHVHGAGTLKIAIEGNKVSMDFSAPAMDILGFEHQPTTPEQTKTLDAAKATLAQPLKVFALPDAAGCSVAATNVVFNAGEPAPAGATPAQAGAMPADAAAIQHADFDVDYELTCTAPGKISTVGFPYFQLFAGAQKLTVTVVSDKGQTETDVTRANSVLQMK